MKLLVYSFFACCMCFGQQPCPAPLAGAATVFTVSSVGQTVTLRMPADVNAVYQSFVAESCDKFSKDITGQIIGTKGAAVPQALWVINLILDRFATMTSNIAELGDGKHAPAAVRAARARAKAEEEASRNTTRDKADRTFTVELK